ncbi:MAG: 3-hydroxyacyl-CoA dehydrogenase family protein [Dehalococcoidales bacterium]|nr:3-hydroxyacyl-CoA dehydrogenase family protein [Dehalococcoidales bacterium]
MKAGNIIMPFRRIGIVGPGVMGLGIAKTALTAGFHVTIVGRNLDSTKAKVSTLADSALEMARDGKLPQELAMSAGKNLLRAANLEELSECGLVIESITEDLPAKQDLCQKLDKICDKRTILATNTSSFTVSDVSLYVKNRERVLGMHFFNPVNRIKLVELVKTPNTSQETFENAGKFCKSLGKTVITPPDIPGFITNRLLMALFSEAWRLYEAGVSIENINKAAMLGLNHPVGPFRLADFIGFDNFSKIARSLQEQSGGEHFTAPNETGRFAKEEKSICKAEEDSHKQAN